MTTKVKLAFSTFLKYLEFNQKRRVSELNHRKSGKGYRFWEPMEKRAAKAANANAEELQNLIIAASAKGSAAQKKFNKAALQAINGKFASKITVYFDSNVNIIVDFGDSNFQIHIVPQIEFTADGKKYCVSVWATSKPDLRQETLSVGFRVLDQALVAQDLSVEPLIYNAVTNKLFRRADLVKNTKALHDLAVTQFREVWDLVIGGHPPPPPSPPGPWPHP